MSVSQIVVLILAGLGVLLMLVTSLGLLRFQGVYRRMHAGSVGASLGVTFVLLSAGVYYADSAQFSRMVILILFFFVTAPIATTALSRAAYRVQVNRIRRYVSRDDLSAPGYTPDYLRQSQENE